jgi:UDP-glucuronate decarboxylase
MARVLVTGGAGFVGSHLCEALLAAGNEVVAMDDFSTGARDNVAHLVGKRGFFLAEHDVREPFDVACDVIFNLASPASPVHYQADPVRTTMVNVLGTLNALRCAERRGARFLQASTSEVYGDPEVHPQPEEYVGAVSSIGPRACYDEGKRCAESLIMDFNRKHGVETRLARIFNTYGPRMAIDDGRVVSNFLVQALRGEAITVYGDGSQTRSFCYVSDLVDGLLRLARHPGETRPVNLGNPGEFTMLELAALVGEVLGRECRVVHAPLPVDDPRQRRPVIERARSVLGYAPKVSLREGLARTAADFAARLRARVGRGALAIDAA